MSDAVEAGGRRPERAEEQTAKQTAKRTAKRTVKQTVKQTAKQTKKRTGAHADDRKGGETMSETGSKTVSKTVSKAASDIYSSSSSSFPSPRSSGTAYSGDEVARAGRTVAKACHWVRRNPGRWASLKAICARLMLEGELVQRGSIYERARQYGIDVRLASQFRRDHNLWSALARYMAMERPQMLSAISFRVTPVDAVDLAAYWRDIVGEDEFAASSLAEARAVWDAQRGAR